MLQFDRRWPVGEDMEIDRAARFFPESPPARIFFCVPEWTGPFDVEVDCIAVTKD
jgi:hypothetical protein